MGYVIKQFSLLVVIFPLSSVTMAQAVEKEILRGIKAMKVVVESLNQDIGKDGLKRRYSYRQAF